VQLSRVERTPLRWLWRGRIPLGKITMLDGDPSLGKSVTMLDIAARVSAGKDWPDGLTGPTARGVVLVCAEDDLSDTMLPRLEAAGANLSRVRAVELERDDEGRLRPLSIPRDMARLAGALDDLRKTAPALLVVDPITAYLGEKTNSNNDPSVRRALLPLAELAKERAVAVVLIRHLNKSGELSAMYRGGGSIAFTALSRSALVAARHPEEEGWNVLAQVKSNLARLSPSLAYCVVPSEDDPDVPVVQWGGEVPFSADELLRGRDARKEAPERDKACAFLVEVLADGPMTATDVEKYARDAGITARTLKRAFDHLGGTTNKVHDKSTGKVSHWAWTLPNGFKRVKSWTP
jgi:hypothetical protein